MKANLGTKKGINVHNSAESTCNRLPKLSKLQLKFRWKEATSCVERLFKSRKCIEHQKDTQTQIYRNGRMSSILGVEITL